LRVAIRIMRFDMKVPEQIMTVSMLSET
jgi:hypothetical protein